MDKQNEAARVGAAVVTALDSGRALGEIFAAIEASKKWPRDPERARASILADLEDFNNAKDCFYSFSLGGSAVTDGSVDLARLIAFHWGNMAHGFRIVSETSHERTVEGWCVDFERNHSAAQQVVFRKALQRKNAKTGETEWIDTDDQAKLDLETKRYAAKVERNAIRECIPANLWRTCLERAQERKRAGGDALTTAERRREMLDACRTFGITETAIARKVGKPVEVMTDGDVDTIDRIFTAVKNGEVSAFDVFDVSPASVEEATAARAAVKAEAKADVQTMVAATEQKAAAATQQKRAAVTVKEAWDGLFADYSAAKDSEPAGSPRRAELEGRWRKAFADLGIKKTADIKTVELVEKIRGLVWPKSPADRGQAPAVDSDGVPF